MKIRMAIGVTLVASIVVAISLVAIYSRGRQRGGDGVSSGTGENAALHISATLRSSVSGSPAEIGEEAIDLWIDPQGERIRRTVLSNGILVSDDVFSGGVHQIGMLSEDTQNVSTIQQPMSWSDARMLIASEFYDAIIEHTVPCTATDASRINDPSDNHESVATQEDGSVVHYVIDVPSRLPVVVERTDPTSGADLSREFVYNLVACVDQVDVPPVAFEQSAASGADASEETVELFTPEQAELFDDFALFYLGPTYEGYDLQAIELREESGAHARELIGYAGRGALPIQLVVVRYGIAGLEGPESQGIEIEIRPLSGFYLPYEDEGPEEPVVLGESPGIMMDQGRASFVVFERDGVQVLVHALSGDQALAAATSLVRLN